MNSHEIYDQEYTVSQGCKTGAKSAPKCADRRHFKLIFRSRLMSHGAAIKIHHSSPFIDLVIDFSS